MLFEVTRVIDAVERISCETGNLFCDDQIEIALFGAGNHALEFTALFGVGAGDAFVRENLVKLPIGVALNILSEIPLLALKGICLIFVVGGNAAIGSHTLSHIDYFSLLIHAFISVHISPPFTMNVSVLWYYGFDFCFLFFPIRLNTLGVERVSADFAALGREGCLSASSERKRHAPFHSILEAVHRYR